MEGWRARGARGQSVRRASVRLGWASYVTGRPGQAAGYTAAGSGASQPGIGPAPIERRSGSRPAERPRRRREDPSRLSTAGCGWAAARCIGSVDRRRRREPVRVCFLSPRLGGIGLSRPGGKGLSRPTVCRRRA